MSYFSTKFSAHQLAAVNAAAAVKFEVKDMQLPAITIDPSGDASGVRIPKFGDTEEQENGSICMHDLGQKNLQILKKFARRPDKKKRVIWKSFRTTKKS